MATGVNISNYAETAILKFLLTNESVTRPTAQYVGLFSDTVDYAIDQPSIEVVGTGYSRQSVNFYLKESNVASNSNVVNFTVRGSWPSIKYVGIFDALTNGNLLFWGVLDSEIILNSGDTIQFAIDTILITID